MAKTLTSKSFSKRVRITRNGKAIRRPMGVNHFKTRKNASGIRKKRINLPLGMNRKQISIFK